MPTKRVPSYCLHKPSGQARVIIQGRHFYLGQYGSAKSHEAYARLIAEHVSPDDVKSRPSGPDGFPDISIDELLVQYLSFAETYYVKNGEPTKELTCMKEAMGHIRALYSSEPARDMGPKKLKAIRNHMINICDLSRGVVNSRVNRVKRIFKWAVSEELVPPSIYEGLRTVTGLAYGRTEARETEPVKPVADEWVDPVLLNVAPQVAAMIELQRLTGMRPEETVTMRPCEIDMTRPVWVYEPFEHKKRWRGKDRRVPLGPRAKEIIKPFLHRKSDAYLFSPEEAEAWRNAERRRNRKTPMTPSQAKRKPKANPKKKKRVRYDTDSYRRAITYGIRKTNRLLKKQDPTAPEIPHWFPYQLRHSFGTRVRKLFGFEAAAVGLGHARTNVTEVYAEQDFNRAMDVAREIG